MILSDEVRKKTLCPFVSISGRYSSYHLLVNFLSTSCQLPTKFLFSSEKKCANTSRYVEIKIISVKFAPIRGQNNLCQSAKSVVKEISAFPCAFAREKIMDAANHVHTKFLSSRYPEQFYLEYKRRAARDSWLRIVAVSHLGRKIYLPFVANAHLLHRDDPAFY